jgi:hypothetical protein
MTMKFTTAFLILCSTLANPALSLASTGSSKTGLLVNGEFGIAMHQAMGFVSVYSDGELRFGLGIECRTEQDVTDPDCISTHLSINEMNLVRAAIQTIHSQDLTPARPIKAVQYLDGYAFYLGSNPELTSFATNDYPYPTVSTGDKLVGAVGSSERALARSLRNLLLNHLGPAIRKFHKTP